MYLKTHIAFAGLILMLFATHVNEKLIFVIAVLVATIIPDLDSGFSSFGRHFVFKPLQFFVNHRGIIHSLTIAVLLSILIAIFWPVASLGFFIGYSIHLIGDSFTKEGVQPFWPLKGRSSGFIRTGGKIEESLFFFLVLIDIVLFFLSFVF